MRILLTGSSGFIGKALSSYLKSKHHEVVCLVRSKAQRGHDAIYWNPDSEEIDPAQFEGFDAVINLAGKNIFCRWSKKAKQEIFLSRVRDTWLLSKV
jgi:NAD dependent epimerase/dehydratase family enzyme